MTMSDYFAIVNTAREADYFVEFFVVTAAVSMTIGVVVLVYCVGVMNCLYFEGNVDNDFLVTSEKIFLVE